MKTTICTIISLFLLSTSAFALPYLQLDISDSIYVGSPEESVVSTGDEFELFALVNTNSQAYSSDETFYISVALTPDPSAGTGPTGDDLGLGSFEFNGTTYDVTADMEYGTPGISTLPEHGMFDTYYAQFEFSFDPASGSYYTNTGTAAAYNVEDDPGGLVDDASGTLAYAAFDIDVSNLADGYELHFDLYTLKSDGTVDKFAPFSHDAESGGDNPPESPVPEPTTLFLMGFGLLGIAGLGRRRVS